MEEKPEVKKFTKEEILSNYKEFFTTVGVSSDSTHKEVLEKYINWLEKKLNSIMKTKMSDFINENNHYDIKDKLSILKGYIHILQNSNNEEKYGIAINYFRVLHNYLIIERMFFDDVVLAKKEINRYLTLEKFDSSDKVYNKFLELYDNNSVVRNNVETLDNIDSIGDYIKKNSQKIFNTFLK